MLTSQDEHWLRILNSLTTSKTKEGVAPHKPFLLLAIAEMVENGELSEPLLPLSGELIFHFNNLTPITAERRKSKVQVKLPFFHLQTSGLWEPLDENGQRSFSRDYTAAVQLDASFFRALQSPVFREKMRRLLIAKYFEDKGERAALYDYVGLPVPPEDEVVADATRYEITRKKGRESRFRSLVGAAYNYTCALYQYRLEAVGGGFIVDAAHIHQFARGGGNDPQNGIALCKNAHWMFDEGLWTLSDDYKILVAPTRFKETGNSALFLQPFEGSQILLPKNPKFWPDKTYLRWHRTHRFGKSRKA
jgi:putative restriction endonuclease